MKIIIFTIILIITILIIYSLYKYFSRLKARSKVQNTYRSPSILPETKIEKGNAIPKLLHRVWIGPRYFPPYKDLNALKSFDQINAGFRKVLWRDADVQRLIKKSHPEYNEIYSGYRLNIQRADLARYLILYEYGGVYSDLDISGFRPMDELLRMYPESNFFSFVEITLTPERARSIGEREKIRRVGMEMGFGSIPEDPERIASYLCICTPKHPMMLAVLEEAKRRSILQACRQYDVFYITGPDLFTTVIHRYLTKYHDVIVIDRKTADNFFIHHGSALWKTFVNFPFR